ncbi:mucin-5AC isoform X1 [Syngnathus acus]|uniref:mucin-5AC isoform X1 n=1 Tax=Syngnathus acus TaxID=161584 RepID=UPI00188629D7|nr:mucin-5AC isoform X1 [Syngnathus acus]
MPEGWRRGSSRSSGGTGAKRPSSASSLSGMMGRMMSSGERGASSSSCTSVNSVCSDCERPASLSLSSSASSVSLQDASSSSSSSSSSLPYGAVPAYKAAADGAAAAASAPPERNGSDISLHLTPLVAGAAAAVPRPLSRLERVVMEIVETEQAYVRDLKSIVEDYLGCIIDCAALPVNPEQVSALFCNIEDIYEFNSELLEDLERSRHAAAIADCFVERSEGFDIYTLYCMNYPNSVSVLRECMKNESLVRFFHERRATLKHSLPLETYLLKPVQRILKYHLLLQELAKHLDKSDPGYEVVEDAIITMTAVAWYINDMKRKQEHAVRLQEIESLLVNWSGPDLSGFGELVLEGSFKVQRVKKERAFFLFDRMLLIAKKRAERFVYSTHIFCCNLQLADTLKNPLCFRVSDLMIPKQQHVVQTKNMEEKRLWVHYLNKLIIENHPASLPHKARQVLGDDFCQSHHFEHERPTKLPWASPRPDDVPAYHRGRRRSEPPAMLALTPEKSRKSLPLLLEANLPYRRTRRQSAPAKDIRAAFHPHGPKRADSEGELKRAHGLSSAAGSGGTPDSSVLCRPEREEEEEEEEDLVALCAPPTLSITEEILELINQSRAREGLLSAEEVLPDQPRAESPPPRQSDFTCPLPPPALREEAETCQNAQEQSAAGAPNGSEVQMRERPQNGLLPSAEELDANADVGKISEGEPHKTESPPGVSILEHGQARGQEEAGHSSGQPDDGPSAEPKPGAERDKRIIEKIKSYYEAAAELQEEEDGGEDEDQTSGRSSPFAPSPTGPVNRPPPPLPNDNQGNEALQTQSAHRLQSASPALVEDSRHGNVDDVHSSPVLLEAKDRNGDDESPIRMEDPDNPSEGPADLPSSGPDPAQKQIRAAGGNQGADQDDGPWPPHSTQQEKTRQEEEEEGKESPKESSGGHPASPPCLQTSSARTRGKHKATGSPAAARRGCRPSRMVSTKRALFEGTLAAADITAIGLFEADPSLAHNSERILSKVQTLATMYSLKGSAAKVPLRQKADKSPAPSLSGHTRPQTQRRPDGTDDAPIRAQAGPKCHRRNQWQRLCPTEARDESSSAKAQMLRERQKRTQPDGKNRERAAVSREDPSGPAKRDGEEPSARRCSPLQMDPKEPSGVLKAAALPGGQEANSACQLDWRGFSLSRPRDFITALNKEHNRGGPDEELQSVRSARTCLGSELREDTAAAAALKDSGPPRKLSQLRQQQSKQDSAAAPHRPDRTSKGDLPGVDKSQSPSNSQPPGTSLPDAQKAPQQTFQRAPPEGPAPSSSGPEPHVPPTSRERLAGLPTDLAHTGEVRFGAGKSEQQNPGRPSSLPLFSAHRSPPRTAFRPSATSSPVVPDEDSRRATSPPVSWRASAVSASPPSAAQPRPSARAVTCVSPFAVIPPSRSAPLAKKDKTLTPVGSSSERAAPPQSLSKGAGPSCAPSAPASSPAASLSAFTRSLAASCISQTLSKKNSGGGGGRPAPSSSLQSPPSAARSPSSRPPSGWRAACLDGNGGYPPSPLRSPFADCAFSYHSANSSCPSSPFLRASRHGEFGSESCSPGPAKAQLANTVDGLSFGSHNRMARPFCASVQSSPAASPPPPFTRVCSPPPASARASQPPPTPGAGSPTTLGLTLKMADAWSSSRPQMTGVPLWTCSVTPAPKARNPQVGSLTRSLSSCSAQENGTFSRTGSPHPDKAHGLRRSDGSPSPAGQARGSWAQGGHESALSGRSPSCPPESPISCDLGGEHCSSPPWLLCTSSSTSPTCRLSSLSQSTTAALATDWPDAELEEGSCRSHLICAYVGPEAKWARALPSSPPDAPRQTCRARSPPRAAVCAPSARRASAQKTSYATTVNLQIAGSGRITSFSTAHVSVSQTPPAAGGQIPTARRVSVNIVASALPHNCSQL